MSLTKIMFIRQTEPVIELHVRVPALDPTQTLTTDAEGRICLALPPGLHTVEIFDQGRWVSHSFQRRQDSELIVVQLEPVLASKTTHNQLKQQLQGLGDRYRIERVLGRGGMGIVIKAHDHVLDRPVAIKMLNEQWQDNATAQKLFFDEARHLAGLKHPNLVAVHDVTTLEGIVVMIMEFVQGLPLDEFLKEHGPLDSIMLHQVAGQLGAALSYLHRQGVIHRDIKPGNMLWREDNTLKIIDFGLARSLKQLNLRGTQVRGTPAYMAPEQLLGQPLTYATDLYQTGVSLFELASGRLPFDEESIATDHIQTLAPSIKSFVPTLEPGLADCIDRSLQKDPSRRPESAACFAQLIGVIDPDLRTTSPEPLFRPSPLPALAAPEPEPQPQGAVKPSRRWPLILVVFSMISLFGIGAFGLWSTQRAPELPSSPPSSALLAKAPPLEAEPKVAPQDPTLSNVAQDAAREQSSSLIHASTQQALEQVEDLQDAEEVEDASSPSPSKVRRARRARRRPEPTPAPAEVAPTPTPAVLEAPAPAPEPAPEPAPAPAPVEVKLLSPPKAITKPEPAKAPAPKPKPAPPKADPEPPSKKPAPIPRSF